MVPLTKEICLDAVAKSLKRRKGASGFGIIDGIILATARSLDQNLLTYDTDFAGEEGCILMGRTNPS